MARVLGLFPAALNAARSGASANAFYRALQAEGIAPRRAEALQLYKIARNVIAKSEAEVFKPTSSVPTAGDISQWPTRIRTGIIQNVTVTLRDKTTGQVTSKPLSIKVQQAITRDAAIAKAVDLASEHAESYNQEIIGAVHTSTYELSPDILSE